MDKQQIKGALILLLVTAVFLGAFSFAPNDSSETLTGTGTGYAGDVVVEVVVDGDTIKSITVVESEDTPGLSDNAFDAIIEAVLEQQSIEGIDVVAGATGSSEGILAAINSAIYDAGTETGDETETADETGRSVEGEVYTGSAQGYDSTITVEVIIAEDEIAAINVVEANDTPGLSDGAFDEIIEAVLANQSVEDVDVVAGATGSSEGILEAISNALSGLVGEVIIEGDVYIGSGQGYDGTIKVEVIIADGDIAAINVVEANDTPGLSDGAFDEIIEAVLANQSVEGVDVVAGATGSSKGILEAIEEALAQ